MLKTTWADLTSRSQQIWIWLQSMKKHSPKFRITATYWLKGHLVQTLARDPGCSFHINEVCIIYNWTLLLCALSLISDGWYEASRRPKKPSWAHLLHTVEWNATSWYNCSKNPEHCGLSDHGSDTGVFCPAPSRRFVNISVITLNRFCPPTCQTTASLWKFVFLH